MNTIKILPQTKKEWMETVGKNIVIFTFIKKKDGSLRKMMGCHSFDWMPSERIPNGDHQRPVSDPNIIRIFDLENQDWRSFDITTLEDIIQIIPTFMSTISTNGSQILKLENEIRSLEKERKEITKKIKEKRAKVNELFERF